MWCSEQRSGLRGPAGDGARATANAVRPAGQACARPGYNETPGDLETVGQTFNVFTLSDGKVIRWRDLRTCGEALAAANAKDQPRR